MKKILLIITVLLIISVGVVKADQISNLIFTDTKWGTNIDATDDKRILFEDTIRLQGDNQLLQLRATTDKDKPIIAFMDENYKTTAYIVTHDYSNNNNDRHRHFEVETAKKDMKTRVGRFNITYGEDVSEITFPNSEVSIRRNNLKIKDELGEYWYLNASSSGELVLTKDAQ